jgi:hypothetical protein
LSVPHAQLKFCDLQTNLSGLALDGLALLSFLGTYIKRFFEPLLYERRDLAGGTEKTESTSLNKDLVLIRVPNPSMQVDTEDASAVVDPPRRTLVEDDFVASKFGFRPLFLGSFGPCRSGP